MSVLDAPEARVPSKNPSGRPDEAVVVRSCDAQTDGPLDPGGALSIVGSQIAFLSAETEARNRGYHASNRLNY